MPKPVDFIFPGDKHLYFTAPKADPAQEDIPAEVAEMREKAQQQKLEGKLDTCVFCDQPFFFVQTDKAYCQGHVYSQAGARDVQITGVCEYCTDAMGDGE